MALGMSDLVAAAHRDCLDVIAVWAFVGRLLVLEWPGSQGRSQCFCCAFSQAVPACAPHVRVCGLYGLGRLVLLATVANGVVQACHVVAVW